MPFALLESAQQRLCPALFQFQKGITFREKVVQAGNFA
jgi:hypothetical protein